MEDWRFPSFDALTGLSQRRDLLDRLKEERPRKLWYKRNVAVMMVDVHHLKLVNDRYGHEVGDAVLRDVAAMLRWVIRPEDVAARLGGSEFIVLFLPEITVTGAVQVVEQLRAILQEYRLRSVIWHPIMHHVFVEKGLITVSVGMSCFLPEDVHTEVLTRADAAMYYAKRWGGNRVCVYDGRTFRLYGQPGP